MNIDITEKTFIDFWNESEDNFKGLIQVIEHLKTEIEPDMKESEDDFPSIQITISVNKDCTTWSYQSGDNSYSGSCYGDPFWGVDYVMQDSDAKQLANTLIDNLADQIEFSS